MATINLVSTLFPQSDYVNPPTVVDVESDIEHYWGKLENEKFYVISLNELNERIQESPVGQAAVRIRNIDNNNPTTIDAKWIAYGNEPGSELQNDDYYFVIDAATITNWQTLGINAVSARIAKTKQHGNIYVFFHRTTVVFRQSGGTGGDNASAGALIPPHP